eukprot:scaffold18158_cov50-Prasinocladus_malaysianus.AAC.1
MSTATRQTARVVRHLLLLRYTYLASEYAYFHLYEIRVPDTLELASATPTGILQQIVYRTATS